MTQRPLFSIIVPTYNRPARLQACLKAIAGLSFPPEAFEVIVVDDSSPQSPEVIVAEAAQHIRASLIVQPHAGPATARNTGAAQAQGEFLAFTDDDSCPHPGWLSAFAARLQKTPKQGMGGLTLNALPHNPYSTASQSIIDFLYATLNANPEQATFFASNNMAMTHEQFNEIGGFDQHFPFAAGEDRDFCARWLERGWGLTFVREAVIDHSHTLDLDSFWRQQMSYGRGGYHFYQLSARRQPKDGKLQAPSFYGKLLMEPFQPSQLRRRFGVRLALLRIISQMATVVGYGRELLARRGVNSF